MKKRFLIPFVLACVSISSCAQSFVIDPANQVSDEDEDSIELPNMSLTVGETQILVASVSSKNPNKEITWISSDVTNSIIQLGESKNERISVTGISTGEVTVTAMFGATASASCVVSVTKTGVPTVTVTSITLSETSKEFTYEGTEIEFELTATVVASIPTYTSIVWLSTNKSVATVAPTNSENSVAGVVIHGVGEADVTATAGSKTSRCRISVNEPDLSGISISLSQTSASLEIKDGIADTLELIPTVVGTTNPVEWQSNAPSVATVSSLNGNGLVTAKGVGTATISATVTEGQYKKTATCSVTVTKKVDTSAYEQEIAAWSKPGHLYLHYLRHTDNDYDRWAVWIWQNFPSSLAGSLWGASASKYEAGLLKGIEPQTFGWMTKGDTQEGAGTDPYEDVNGRVIDIDLTIEDEWRRNTSFTIH